MAPPNQNPPPVPNDDEDDETYPRRSQRPADPNATQGWLPPADPDHTSAWSPTPADPNAESDHTTAWTPDFSNNPTLPGNISQSQPPTLPGRQSDPNAPTGPVPANPRQQRANPRPILPDDSSLYPRRVPERDPNATRVQPRTAYVPAAPPIQATPPVTRRRRTSGNFMQFAGIIVGLLVVLVLIVGFILAGYTWWQYQRIARDLPPVADLRDRASTFESTYIYDRNSQLVYTINDPTAGRRTYVDLEDISPYVIAATIATEDARFWENLGFDPIAIVRAVWQNYQAGETVSGASTITQQLARALLLSAEERLERTNDRKVREIILATQMRAAYAPDDILELYLNEIYYGNMAYGIEAAAQTYFNKSARDLTLGEATFLAGLPQSPATYDIFQNRDRTLARQRAVMALLLESTAGCDINTGAGGIRVNSAGDRVCVTQEQAIGGLIEIDSYNFVPPRLDVEFPHWAIYIRQVLEDTYGAAEIYRAGLRVYTTLDANLQRYTQQQVTQRVESLTGSNVTNGAVVVIDPTTGEILSMIGSDNYFDPTDGQINMALRPRQPGSSIKPFTYLLAFENGWTPATLIWDVPSEFPDGANPPYIPRNYDGRFHGPLTVRDSLANSYNIPAVKALEFVGIYDNPNTDTPNDGLIPFLQSFGITSLTSTQYGLSLTLGGGEVSLIEWSTAYATLANGGRRVDSYAISQITNAEGTVICERPSQPLTPAQIEQLETPVCEIPAENWGQPVVSEQTAFLISNVLSDNGARYLAFGPGNFLETSVGAAVKTGTTNDVRDLWAVGYVPNLVVGVWVGNADNSPMGGGVTSSGVSGSIWNAIMQNAWSILGRTPQPFPVPGGIVSAEACYMTGTAATDYCRNLSNPLYPSRSGAYPEVFLASNPPPGPENELFVEVAVELFSGKLVGPACLDLPSEMRTFINLTDPWALRWLENDGTGQQFAAAYGITFPVEQLPTDECSPTDPRPELAIQFPANDGEEVSGVVDVWGFANIANGELDYFLLEYGLGTDPQGWRAFTDQIREGNSNANPRVLGQFDTADIEPGEVTLRLVIFDRNGNTAEVRRIVRIMAPPEEETPTEEPTIEPTNTPIATFTPGVVTATSSATATPSPTVPAPSATVPAPSATVPAPSDTPAPTATEEAPTPTPTSTP